MGVPVLKEEHRCGLALGLIEHLALIEGLENYVVSPIAAIVPLTKYTKDVTIINPLPDMENDSTLVYQRKVLLPTWNLGDGETTGPIGGPTVVKDNMVYTVTPQWGSFVEINSYNLSQSIEAGSIPIENLSRVFVPGFKFLSGLIFSNNLSLPKTAYALVTDGPAPDIRAEAEPDQNYWSYLAVFNFDIDGYPVLSQPPIPVDLITEDLWAGPPEEYAAYVEAPPLKKSVGKLTWGYSPTSITGSLVGNNVDLMFCVGGLGMYHVARNGSTGTIAGIYESGSFATKQCVSMTQIASSDLDASLRDEIVGSTHLYSIVGTIDGLFLVNYTVPTEGHLQNAAITEVTPSNIPAWANMQNYEVTTTYPSSSTAATYILCSWGNYDTAEGYVSSSVTGYIQCPLVASPSVVTLVTTKSSSFNHTSKEPFNGNPHTVVFTTDGCIQAVYLSGHHTLSSTLTTTPSIICEDIGQQV